MTDLRTPLAIPRTIDELRPGHIVFCSRPSLMQRLNESVGDDWRHVGVVVETADGLFLAGFGRLAQFSLMPLSSLYDYPRVGVASVFSDGEQTELAHRWTMHFADKKTHYPTSSIPMAGLLSYGRTQPSAIWRWAIMEICLAYCGRLNRRYRNDIAFICSTFVASVINAASPRAIELKLASPKVGGHRRDTQDQNRDDLLARWLATPSDLWRALPAERRAEVSPTGRGPVSQPIGI